MKTDWKKLLIAIAVPLAVGGLSAWLTSGAMENFSDLKQPPLSPPRKAVSHRLVNTFRIDGLCILPCLGGNNGI